MTKCFLTIDIISLHELCSSLHLSKNNHNHNRGNKCLRNTIFLLPDTKPWEAKRACNPFMIVGYYLVFPNENEGGRCLYGWGGEGLHQRQKKTETIVSNP